jgi:hypothetical protein
MHGQGLSLFTQFVVFVIRNPCATVFREPSKNWQMANCEIIWRRIGLVCLFLLLTAPLRAQTTGTISKNPVNPFGVAIRTTNYPQPIRYGLDGGQLVPWFITLADSYIFLDQRSKVGGVSFDSDSELFDFSAVSNLSGTCVNIAYAYTHASGSSEGGESEKLSQSLGSLSLLQPFWFIPGFSFVDDKAQGPLAKQLALNLGGAYGNSWGQTESPHFASFRSSSRAYTADALLNCQLAYFPDRSPSPPYEQKPGSDDYATLFVEISSGIQLSGVRSDSSEPFFGGKSVSRQVTYQNIVSLDYSPYRRFGLFLSAEWDAPLDSNPGRNSRPYYANIAIFTVGLTYNYSPGDRPRQRPIANFLNPKSWSLSLLYSYTAFDPLSETNQLQVQISYSF